MFARIQHVAIYTENYQKTARFYQTIFSMKKITTGMTDEKGNYDPNRGHISDGVIWLALLQRHAGIRSGLDHIGFKVEALEKADQDLVELSQSHPESAPKQIDLGRFGHITKREIDSCTFGRYTLSDPDGVLLDLVQ